MEIFLRIHARNEDEVGLFMLNRRDSFKRLKELGGGIVQAEIESEERGLKELRASIADWPVRPQIELRFSAKEMQSVSHFGLLARRINGETASDTRCNQQALATAQAREQGAEAPVRLVEGVRLERIRCPGKEMAGMAEWGDEYIVGDELAGKLKVARFSGLELRAILNPRTGNAYSEAFQLFSCSFLPPAMRDGSIVVGRSDFAHGARVEGTTSMRDLRLLGALSYRKGVLSTSNDFNRTAEPLADLNTPIWVVSKQVREFLAKNRVSGVRLKPVLEEGTEIYGRYIDKFTRLRAVAGFEK